MRISSIEARALPGALRPTVPCRVGSGASGSPGGDARRRPLRRRPHGVGERRPPAGSRCARVVPHRARSLPHGGRPRARRDSGLSRRAAVDGRGRRLGSGRQGHRAAGLEAPRRPLGRLLAVRVERRAGRRRKSGRAAASRCATPASRPSRSASTRATGGRTSRSSRPSGMRSGQTSRSWSTRIRAGACRATSTPRWDVATAAQVARALEPLGVYWLEEPLRTDDLEGYAALRRLTSLRLAAGEMVRSGAGGPRPRRSAAASTCSRPTSSSRAGSAVAAASAALADLPGAPGRRTRGRTATACVANLHAALAFSTVPVRRGALRPAGVVGGAARLAAAGAARDRSRRDDRAPDGPGFGVEPDLEALERWRVG